MVIKVLLLANQIDRIFCEITNFQDELNQHQILIDLMLYKQHNKLKTKYKTTKLYADPKK